MEEPGGLTRHIEAFVDASRPASEQAAGLQELASLLKKDIVSIGTLIREMELYLTTTDHIIRSRGVILLGELVLSLSSKPMDNATIHSLIVFFSDRLADWKALRGSLIGCLALLRRKGDVGMVTVGDAKAVAQSFRFNLHVQSHGQHDRLLCFELLECLLEKYPEAVLSLDNDIFYVISEAAEYEKDPDCLLLVFRIVGLATRLFPESSGPLVGGAEGLFDILGRYFPIYFTHLKHLSARVMNLLLKIRMIFHRHSINLDNRYVLDCQNLFDYIMYPSFNTYASLQSKAKDSDVKRDELSQALMLAFASTPLFEPFAIPLLLEKLSSSVHSAKIDSLKYLSYCALKYGADRMGEHAAEIWSSLKREVFSSSQEPVFSFNLIDGLGLSENDIAKEALEVLATVVTQNRGLYLEFLVNDKDVNLIFNDISSHEKLDNICLQTKQKLHGVGCLLAVAAKSCIFSCNKVFEHFFPKLMGTLGISISKPSGNCFPSDKQETSRRLNFGALYFCLVLLESCRDVIADSDVLATEICCSMVMDFSVSLTRAFSSFSGDGDLSSKTVLFLCVKGLQILATFGGGFQIMSRSSWEYILTVLVAVVFVHYNATFMWDLALKALVSIGSSVDKYQEPEKVLCYMAVVVEKISLLLTSAEIAMPYVLKLSAASQIAMCGRSYTRKIIQGLEDAIFSNLAELYANGNAEYAGITIQLLECLSRTLLPWLLEFEGFEEIPEHFIISMWNQIEQIVAVSTIIEEKDIFDAIMTAVKLSVSSCSVRSQTKIIDKAYGLVSSNPSFPLAEFAIQLDKIKELHVSLQPKKLSTRDRWVLSLFSSTIVAMHPQTRLPDVKAILLFLVQIVLEGHIPSAEALGSLLNKLSSTAHGEKSSNNCSLEEALDLIFNMSISNSGGPSRTSAVVHFDKRMNIADICLGASPSKFLQVNAIVGLAWMGKGLLMRGHEKVKDITMTLVECLLSDRMKTLDQSSDKGILEREQEFHSIIRCGADAFHILMSDSEASLSRRLHAVVRPLYKQRFFLMVMPIFQKLIVTSDSNFKRSLLCLAFAHVISETPLVAIMGEAKKLIPIILDALLMFSEDSIYKDRMYSLLLLLSGILTEKAGQDAVNENARIIISCLTRIIRYPHMMLVRETAVQCLAALSTLPHVRIYPMRKEVLQAVSRALDDPKRCVREEAVRCRQAWASITGSVGF